MLQYLQETESKYQDGKLSAKDIVVFFETMKNDLSIHVAKCPTCDLKGPAKMTDLAHTSLSLLYQQQQSIDPKKIKAFFEQTGREFEKLDETIVIFVKI